MNVTRLYFGCGDFVFRHGHEVPVEDDEISVFPDFDAAFAVFEETTFGHPNGDGTQGLFAT